jgi:aminoglycoside phosphotransferase (APT) family kinase protein
VNDRMTAPLPEFDAAEAQAMAVAVIQHYFGSKPAGIDRQGGGLTNFVFAIDHREGAFIVRLSPQPAKINDYLKEQWAIARARAVGVPTPEVLEVGCEAVSTPYMIARQVEGFEATHHPQRMRILREMGALTALIHTVPTSGYGQTFDWSGNQLSRNESWTDYLTCELKAGERIHQLEAHRLLSAAQAQALRAVLEGIGSWTDTPVLNHGDVRLKNVLVDESGAITALIDWEFCTSNVAPYWDLSLALHDLSIDAKQEYLSGYGLQESAVRAMAPALKALNLINYAPYVTEAAEANDMVRLERYRTRLNGALDLFSL